MFTSIHFQMFPSSHFRYLFVQIFLSIYLPKNYVKKYTITSPFTTLILIFLGQKTVYFCALLVIASCTNLVSTCRPAFSKTHCCQSTKAKKTGRHKIGTYCFTSVKYFLIIYRGYFYFMKTNICLRIMSNKNKIFEKFSRFVINSLCRLCGVCGGVENRKKTRPPV